MKVQKKTAIADTIKINLSVMKPNVFVFDVESTSLYGSGFAVGVIVIDRKGNFIDKFELMSTEGMKMANKWVSENVLPHIHDMPRCESLRELRDRFFQFYMKYRESADIWSDCNFPVETNFLSDVVRDDPDNREFLMPYPLLDISTIIGIDIDRSKEAGLCIDNLRKHHPYDDAKASAFCLLNCGYHKRLIFLRDHHPLLIVGG